METERPEITPPSETRFTLRVDSALFEKVKQIAKLNKRSAAKQVEFILEDWLRQHTNEG